MIVHIALIKWKQTVNDKDIKVAIGKIKLLKSSVDGILEIKVGKNFSKWNKGFTEAIVVFSKDKKSLEKYKNHKDHKIISKWIEKNEEKSLGFDFED